MFSHHTCSDLNFTTGNATQQRMADNTPSWLASIDRPLLTVGNCFITNQSAYNACIYYWKFSIIFSKNNISMSENK